MCEGFGSPQGHKATTMSFQWTHKSIIYPYEWVVTKAMYRFIVNIYLETIDVINLNILLLTCFCEKTQHVL